MSKYTPPTFEDLEFRPHEAAISSRKLLDEWRNIDPDGRTVVDQVLMPMLEKAEVWQRARYTFPNGYVASVVTEFLEEADLYELAVLGPNRSATDEVLSCQGDDVIRMQTPEQITQLLALIARAEPVEQTTDES